MCSLWGLGELHTVCAPTLFGTLRFGGPDRDMLSHCFQMFAEVLCQTARYGLPIQEVDQKSAL